MKISVLKALRSPVARIPKLTCPGHRLSSEHSWENMNGEETRNGRCSFNYCCFYDTEVPVEVPVKIG